MLPTELLIHRSQGESLRPKRLPLDGRHRELASELIRLFADHQGKTQAELDHHLKALAGDSPDYRVMRGLAHLLKNHFAHFEAVSILPPVDLRQRVFRQAAQRIPTPAVLADLLDQMALQLSQELSQDLLPIHLEESLYADLPDNHRLTTWDPPSPDALIHRYNLSQVQGIFYKASQVVLHAYRNDPGEYKLLFRYLKLFQLMAYIEGDADHGFTISVDGPTSLFGASTRYGLAMAKWIPALLHVSRWSLTATLHSRDPDTRQPRIGRFSLAADCGLVSHYPPSSPYDSLIESSFAEAWATLKTDWQLEREVDLIPLPGSVMIPDFRLVHPDGRVYLLEIIGYWRPDYLKKKFWQVRQSGCRHLILAISERLNVAKSGIQLQDIGVPILWFKERLLPKAVLALLNAVKPANATIE
ncbi:MAG: DUF790 family protein [Cyanobacteriota bacterium]|nr:DUF790 family protein [Cyanobacteriota bacterium]